MTQIPTGIPFEKSGSLWTKSSDIIGGSGGFAYFKSTSNENGDQ